MLFALGICALGTVLYAWKGCEGIRPQFRLVEPVEQSHEGLWHDDNLLNIAFSPDGKVIVTASADGTAKFWNTQTGKATGTVLHHHDGIQALAFGPDGSQLWTGGFDQVARCWNTSTGKLKRTLRHENRVQALALSPDGKSLITASRSTAQLWDAASGKPIGNPQVFDDLIWSVAFSPDCRHAVIGTNHGNGTLAVLLDARTGLRVGTPMSHDDDISAVAFALNGTVVLTGTSKGTLQRWDLASKTATPFESSSDFLADVEVIAVSSDGKTAVTGHFSGFARLWDVENLTMIGTAIRHQGHIHCATFSPDNSLVLTGSHDATARFWDAQTGEPRSPPLRHGRRVANSVLKVAFRPDGEIAVTMPGCSCAWLWNVKEVCSPEAQGTAISRRGGFLPPSPLDENLSEDENPVIDK